MKNTPGPDDDYDDIFYDDIFQDDIFQDDIFYDDIHDNIFLIISFMRISMIMMISF